MDTKFSFVFPLVFGYLLGTSFAATCYDADLSGICGANVTFIPNLSTRGPGTVVTEELFQWKYCDVYAIDRGQWYHSNTPMTNACPDMYMCGTKFPIWLQGQRPVRNGGIVNVTACLRDFDTCCLRTYSIAAVNCGNTLAYCFNELPSGCHQRYCFDEYYTETTLQITPWTTLPTIPETTLQTTPETTLQTTPETTLQTTPETTLQTTQETTLQTTPETTLHTTPETTLQTTQETTLQTTPETTLQTTLSTEVLTTFGLQTTYTSPIDTTSRMESANEVITASMRTSKVQPTSTMQSQSTTQAQQMERKDSDAIIIIVACLCVLLSVVIALLVVIIRRRRAKQSKNSDKPLDKPNVDEWIPKTADIGRDYQVLGEYVKYESLKNLDKHDFIGAGYASLKQLNGSESEGNMTCLSQHEVIFDARLAAMNKLYERSANVSEDYEIPNPTMEEDHYQTLP